MATRRSCHPVGSDVHDVARPDRGRPASVCDHEPAALVDVDARARSSGLAARQVDPHSRPSVDAALDVRRPQPGVRLAAPAASGRRCAAELVEEARAAGRCGRRRAPRSPARWRSAPAARRRSCATLRPMPTPPPGRSASRPARPGCRRPSGPRAARRSATSAPASSPAARRRRTASPASSGSHGQRSGSRVRAQQHRERQRRPRRRLPARGPAGRGPRSGARRRRPARRRTGPGALGHDGVGARRRCRAPRRRTSREPTSRGGSGRVVGARQRHRSRALHWPTEPHRRPDA